MSGNRFRWLVLIFSLLGGLYALAPSAIDIAGDGKLNREIPAETREQWGPVLLDYVEPLTLGLDLQGGLLLQYNVLVDKAVLDKLDRMVRDIESRLLEKDAKLEVTVKHPQNQTYIEVTFADATKGALINDDFMNFFTNLKKVEMGGGVYQLVMEETYIDETKKFAVEQALETIRQRVDGLGIAEPSITRRGESDIVVQLPGLKEKDVDRAKKLIGTTAMLEFRMVDDVGPTNNFFNKFRGGKLPVGFALRQMGGGRLTVTHQDKDALATFLKPKLDEDHVLGFERQVSYEDAEKKVVDEEASYWKTYYIKKKVELTGDYITDSRVAVDQQFNKPYVAITFDSEGAELFGDLSTKNVDKQMAIMLDDVVKSAPAFEEPILGGNARITMGALASYGELQQESQDLVIVLRHGALPAPIEKQFETVVGPSLGQESIDSSTRALLFGALFVILFMLVYYRGSGFISVVALVFNVVFIMAALALFGATLTLPGIAGIILTIGMAVDANVIIFERIREELDEGSAAREAIAAGYGKAFSAVMDANITTGIAGLVLLQFGTGPVKGFAVTLLVGIIGTIFTAVFVSRMLFDNWITGDKATKNELSI
jgi:preprotein translocase subunit SecD